MAPPQPPVPTKPRWLLAIGLFAATFVTSTTLGAHWALAARTDVVSPIPAVPWLGVVFSPQAFLLVWTTPALLAVGLSFSVPALFILLCHEMGHYVLCRRYGITATLPYFVPTPIALGTFGAFIRIRSLIRDKRELFDVGIAGPIAGFVALLPFLVLGIAKSQPAAVELAAPDQTTAVALLQPGKSLAMVLLTRLLHGPLPPGTVLNLHPFALAAWVGLLATTINLLPLGQLDGGHILYAVVGARVQRRVVIPIWLALLAAGLVNPGWIVWAVLVAILGLRHPPLADEATPLGRGRMVLAVVALLMLVLCFMPVPIDELYLAG
jgi:membrane-associated protease RseP (regulator of RpoE activity)